MDACEIAHFLATELFMQQSFHLGPIDNGIIHSGVPTQTTSTLTPTTLRNIEQTFFDLTNESPSSVPCQAGFVAPLPSFQYESEQHHDPENSLGSSGGDSSIGSSSCPTPPPNLLDDSTAGTNNNPAPRRNMGGRRPKHSSNLSPAEEEKRKVRRERNKLAAARCRKRRVDQTNTLVEKVTELEKEKMNLLAEIENLKTEKQTLENYFDDHRLECRLLSSRKSPMHFKQPANANVHQQQQQQQQQQQPQHQQQHHQQQEQQQHQQQHQLSMNQNHQIPQHKQQEIIVDKIKTEPNDGIFDGPTVAKRVCLTSLSGGENMMPMVATGSPTTLNTPTIPQRPNVLNFRPMAGTASQLMLTLQENVSEIAGVSITTPSNGFNYMSLMEGGTGLTPVISQPLMPNCPSPMNRQSIGDLQTPTTTEPSKLLSI